MFDQPLKQSPVVEKIKKKAIDMERPDMHLNNLIASGDRLKTFSGQANGMFYDFSRQRLDKEALELLLELAEQAGLQERYLKMTTGEKVNTTENRAALHTAARCSSTGTSIMVDDMDALATISRVKKEIREFSLKIKENLITGTGGCSFKHIVVVGIGGSYLGTEFASTALAAYADRGVDIRYLANVDIHNFGKIAAEIEPRSTLWIIISKSYTTAETMANAEQVNTFMRKQGLDPSDHIVTVTAKGSPGDSDDKGRLAAFHMFDFIGGRYSVTSAVGGVPLSLYLGYDRFEAFLNGAEKMDIHSLQAPPSRNLPLLAALISVWNTYFLGYQQQAIIPYASPLSKLAPHIQQLNMESNGKSVTDSGIPLEEPAGMIIFGEPGTNAQHSFFQLAHQGRPFPIDFIGVIHPQYDQFKGKSKGVTNHQELWANMIAQASALAKGHKSKDPARSFSGNRPSSTIILNDLTPESVGALLAFYEARTVYEAFLWGINPFDQFGVELGKVTAGDIRNEMARLNDSAGEKAAGLDHIECFYIDALNSGRIENPN